MDRQQSDMIIIGAGPIGLACAIEAKKAGLSYILLDKGCLVNSLYRYPYNMTFFSTSERLEIGGVPFISHGYKPNRAEALEYYRRVCSSWALEVKLYEEVTRVIRTAGEGFVCETRNSRYTGRAVVFALGFYDLPFLLNIPGEDLPKVKHYYDEPHPYFGQRVAVIGASNSAVDAALETWRKGAFVTMIIRDGAIKESVKYWVRPDIDNRIEEGSITAFFNSEVVEVTPAAIRIRTPEGEQLLENDFVLAMTGYQPPLDFLTNAGVVLGNDAFRTPVYDPETMETNVPGIYLAGVVCGGLKTNKWFIENSRAHAPLIINSILKKNNSAKS